MLIFPYVGILYKKKQKKETSFYKNVNLSLLDVSPVQSLRRNDSPYR